MNAHDWLDLLRDEQEALRKRGWRWVEGRLLRDRDGYCPLCALAALHGCTEYKGAWIFALQKAFGASAVAAQGAARIAWAADELKPPFPHRDDIRAELINILRPSDDN